MSMKKELVVEALITMMEEQFDRYLELDETQMADTVAIRVLSEIQDVLQTKSDFYDPNNDFEIVEEIVKIFYKYNLNPGPCHDFG